MAKRKEYLIEAEKSMLNMIIAYHADHGKEPDGYPTLKASLTRAYNKLNAYITNEMCKRMGVKHLTYTHTQSPEYQQLFTYLLKEIQSDVDDFWVRLGNS